MDKTFYQNSDKFGYSSIKNDIMLCIYIVFTKNPLSLFKIDALNCTMYI